MIWDDIESFQKDISKKILALKPIKVGDRKIYPLVKVLEMNQIQFHAKSIEPIALLVMENDEKYLISLDEKEPSPELLDMVSG